MRISYASLSEAGPRSVNEDFLECWVTAAGETIACIADGLGGMGGGDVAARLAINTFRAQIDMHQANQQSMLAAGYAAHQAIRAAQQQGPSNRMASTLTALALSTRGIIGIHCGDSRAAIARGKGIKRLTKDHSEGQRLHDAGKLSKDEMVNYKRKHILESALGNRDEPRIDPIYFDLLTEDRVILTTDGVHNIVKLQEMQKLCSEASDPNSLIKRVEHAVEQYGPTDNFSMIALFASD